MATIVLIEDEAVLREVVSHVLQSDGHEVVSFPDARPALDAIDFRTVDLVLTDLAMPTRGEEAIETLRGGGYEVPIVVLTGVLTEGEEDGLIELGANRVLLKPVNLSQLLTVIRECLPAEEELTEQTH